MKRQCNDETHCFSNTGTCDCNFYCKELLDKNPKNHKIQDFWLSVVTGNAALSTSNGGKFIMESTT